jgi:hypothetical protein
MWSCSPRMRCWTGLKASTLAVRRCAPRLGRCGPPRARPRCTLTLNPVVEPGTFADRAVVRSVLLIIDPAAPPAIRTAAAITQELRRGDGSWRITRRTVAPAGGPS